MKADVADYSTTVILAYDTLDTLPSESRFIWRKRKRLGSLLYLGTRYFSISYLVMLFTFSQAEGSETVSESVVVSYELTMNVIF